MREVREEEVMGAVEVEAEVEKENNALTQMLSRAIGAHDWIVGVDTTRKRLQSRRYVIDLIE